VEFRRCGVRDGDCFADRVHLLQRDHVVHAALHGGLAGVRSALGQVRPRVGQHGHVLRARRHPRKLLGPGDRHHHQIQGNCQSPVLGVSVTKLNIFIRDGQTAKSTFVF